MKKKPSNSLRPCSGAEVKNRLKPGEEELQLGTTGKLQPPKTPVNVAELLKIPTGRVAGNEGIQALLDEREEGR
jgi:hypothetical protein